MFYICFSKTSQGQGLRDSIGKEDHVTFLNRAECCQKFNIEDDDDNIKVMQQIIAKVPPSSVVLFDEVPLTSKFEKQKASYDWSLLENKRSEQVSVVVCLQPLLIAATLKTKAQNVKTPPTADLIELTDQHRNTVKISGFVNQLCRHELPIEYANVPVTSSHNRQGPVIEVVSLSDLVAFECGSLTNCSKS